MPVEQDRHQELVEKWGADNIPYSSSLAFDMPEVEGTTFRRYPSFRAMLVHKINVICRTCDPPTWKECARVLRISESVLRKWRSFLVVPRNNLTWQHIDTEYDVALDRLRIAAAKTQARREAQPRYGQTPSEE